MASFSEIAFDGVDAFDRNSFSIDALASAGTGSYSLTGADIGTGVSTVAGVGAYILIGALVGTGISITAGVGAYVLTGTDANTEYHPEADAGVGSYILTGADATLAKTTIAGVGSYLLTGADAGTGVSTVAGVGAYTLTGTAANTEYHPVTSAGVGAYSLTGQNISTEVIENVSFDNNAFDEAAFDVDAFLMLEAGSPTLGAVPGSYVLTGTDASTIESATLTIISAEAGSYALTGATANTYPAAGSTAFPLTVDFQDLDTDSPFFGAIGMSGLVAGDIVVFVNTTAILALPVVMSGTGVFTVTGTVTEEDSFDYFIYDLSDGSAGTTEQITVLKHPKTVAEVGAYVLTGADVNTEHHRVMGADVGSYNLTGADVTGVIVGGTETLDAEVGSYTYAGADVVTQLRQLDAEVGAYLLTGADTTTFVGLAVVAELGTYLLTGADAGTKITSIVMVGEAGIYVLTGADVSTITALRRVTCTLVRRTGAVLPNLSNISWAWFDEIDPSDFNAPTDQGNIEDTDVSGVINILLPGSVLTVGQIGTLILRSDDGLLLGAYNLDISLS